MSEKIAKVFWNIELVFVIDLVGKKLARRCDGEAVICVCEGDYRLESEVVFDLFQDLVEECGGNLNRRGKRRT